MLGKLIVQAKAVQDGEETAPWIQADQVIAYQLILLRLCNDESDSVALIYDHLRWDKIHKEMAGGKYVDAGTLLKTDEKLLRRARTDSGKPQHTPTVE